MKNPTYNDNKKQEKIKMMAETNQLETRKNV